MCGFRSGVAAGYSAKGQGVADVEAAVFAAAVGGADGAGGVEPADGLAEGVEHLGLLVAAGATIRPAQ